MRSVRAPIAALLALHTSACSWVSASPGDYADYRATRVLPTRDERLRAAAGYLEERPDGAYAETVRAYFQREEPRYFAEREKSPGGLRAYVEALPRGPHAPEARSRLRVIAEELSRPDPLLLAAQATRERLARASASREKAQLAVGRWLELLMSRRAFEEPLSDGPGDLLVAFSLALPAPICSDNVGTALDLGAARTCEKEVSALFEIPVGGTLKERELFFGVELAQDSSGRPVRATLASEDLFARLEETYAKKAVRLETLTGRINAVERAVEFVSGVFERVVSEDPSCRRTDVVAPEVLRLECSGMRVRVIAGTTAGELDIIEIEPVSGVPAP